MTLLAHEKPIFELEATIEKLKEQNKNNPLWTQAELQKMEKKLYLLKKNVYSQLKPWDRVAICRHPLRPHAVDYVQNIMEDFVELFGDRASHDDHAIISGLAHIGKKVYGYRSRERKRHRKSHFS